MHIKIHKSRERIVVAVADSELIGKTLKNKKYEVKISEYFYKGEEKPEEEIIKILETASNINLIGKEAVKAGLKAKIISKEKIIKIQGIPHAQAYSL